MNGWQITCGVCGQTNDTSLWMETLMGPLPGADLQCPNCKVAIRRKALGSKTIGSGDLKRTIPERICIEKIPARL